MIRNSSHHLREKRGKGKKRKNNLIGKILLTQKSTIAFNGSCGDDQVFQLLTSTNHISIEFGQISDGVKFYFLRCLTREFSSEPVLGEFTNVSILFLNRCSTVNRFFGLVFRVNLNLSSLLIKITE